MAIYPTLDIYKKNADRFPEGFRDYYFQVILRGDDGNDYFLIYSLATNMGMNEKADLVRLEISTEPLWYLTTPKSRIVQKGETPEISIGGFQPVGSLKTEKRADALVVSVDNFEVVCTPPSYQFRYSGDETALDLSLKAMGIPFWYSFDDEKGSQISPSNVVWGLELVGEVEGWLRVNGRTVNVKGVGLHEHVIMPQFNWFEYGWHNWIWFCFDELYGLVQETQQVVQYKKGAIFLRKEQQFLEVNDLDVDNYEWAFSPVLQHQFPVSTRFRATTDAGDLYVEGTAVRAQPWGHAARYKPILNIVANEYEMDWNGWFKYKDGRRVLLQDGKGVSEVIGSFNFIASNSNC